jgi:hypothetical protein
VNLPVLWHAKVDSSPQRLAAGAVHHHAMPSFDLNQPFSGPSPDLVACEQDFMDCIHLYGISPSGKDYVAFLQETDDVMPQGNWSCLIARRDFDAYGFDLARGRGLLVCGYREHNGQLEFGEITSANH